MHLSVVFLVRRNKKRPPVGHLRSYYNIFDLFSINCAFWVKNDYSRAFFSRGPFLDALYKTYKNIHTTEIFNLSIEHRTPHKFEFFFNIF